MTSQNLSNHISETKLILTDINKEKKELRRCGEQLSLYLADHQDEGDEHKNQVKGFIEIYSRSYDNWLLLESVMKVRLKDIEEKKKNG